MKRVRIKICGITNLEDADAALEVGASSIGVNLVPGSPRQVDLETARKIAAAVGRNALTVLVVVLQVRRLRRPVPGPRS